ncbi:unnamed protein product [Brassica rapa subsp. trilocularis]
MNLPLIHTSLAAMVDFLLAQTIGRKTITRLGVLIQPQLLHQNVLEEGLQTCSQELLKDHHKFHLLNHHKEDHKTGLGSLHNQVHMCSSCLCYVDVFFLFGV